MDKGTAAERSVHCQTSHHSKRAVEGRDMESTESPPTRYVVGIDVAKQAHVVCALAAPSGALRHKPSAIAASAEG
jgi:hypothetical protein